MTRVALVVLAPAAPGLAAWAAAHGAAVHVCAPDAALRTAVGAFADGHAAVLLVRGPAPPDALLGLAARELAAPMTAVLGPDARGGLALVGLTEIVPALLAAERLDAGLAAAFDAGLDVVVLPEAEAV